MKLELVDPVLMHQWCLLVIDRKYAEIKDVKGRNVKTHTITLKSDKVTKKLKMKL